jgi:superfamily II DNA/RNA helicase
MTLPQAPLAKQLSQMTSLGDNVDRDEVLTRFLDHVAALGFELYRAQEEAILDLLQWRHVVLNTPTGSGKSLVAAALHFQALAERRVSFYTSPIKALANEKFFDLCDTFGPENVGLMTGDAAVNKDAPIICCTAEILANMALREPKLAIDYVVMDEFHYYGDRDRGMAWQIPLITLRDTVFLMMSATLGDVSVIAKSLDALTDRKVSVITGAARPVPLFYNYRDLETHENVQILLDEDQAPIYLVNFTQRSCAEQAQNLTSLKVCTKEERQALSKELAHVRFDTPNGKELSRFLRAGVGVHHAGLLPKYRLTVEKLSQVGMLKVISGTDSLGVGVNIPIRTVVFRQLCKFDGEKTAILTAREFHQIAGRAGRRGFDDRGLVVAQSPEHIAENKKIEAKRIKNPHLKNKLVNKKPPVKGYVHWDEKVFDRLVQSQPEPMVPRFEVNHGMLVNVLQSQADVPGGGYRRLVRIVRRSHLRDAEKRIQLRLAKKLFDSLRRVGIVGVLRVGDEPIPFVRVRTDLQKDFSLNQALSLYLVEVIEVLDRDHENYALDLLTVVESILEDPQAVLFKQVDRLKGELVGKLKAEGMEYEERMAELEKVEYPKPNAEFIYETFNTFAKNHPWVGTENIKPKSIARDMYEQAMTFNDYVRHLGLARSEGVLLRHLSQVYKTCVQNVPESFRTEPFDDIIAYLHTTITRVDSSLIEEWERMMDGEVVRIRDPRKQEPEPPRRPRDLASDMHAFVRRIRNEMFMLLRALANRDYEAAVECVRPSVDEPWTDKRFEQALMQYFEQHASIDVSPRARHTENTIVRHLGDRRWEVLHKIVDPQGDGDWVIDGIVDLEALLDESEPLVQLVRIGT